MDQKSKTEPLTVRAKEAARITGLTEREVWRLASSDPAFPKPFKLSPKCTVFSYAVLKAWVESKGLAISTG
jgi:predicted DNA-binding transcriptional regulator AlpA